MFQTIKWRNIKIRGKYNLIFSFAAAAFLVSVLITYFYLDLSSRELKETRSKNELSTYAEDLVSLYQEKYLLIPEYILLSDDEKLDQYLQYSSQFVKTAKKLKPRLDRGQMDTFNKLIGNNNQLDQQFFSVVVPNVQQINTAEYKEMQALVNQLKEDTSKLGKELKHAAASSSEQAMDTSLHHLSNVTMILIITAAASIGLSFLLLYLVSVNIRKNLNNVITVSEEIAGGNLNVKNLDYEGTDEIGQLSKSINYMGQRLRDMISSISNLSKEVDLQSVTLLESTEEVKQGSEQIALTIEDISKNGHSQAENAAKISMNTQAFSDEMANAKENTVKLVDFTNQILQVSIHGDQQMHESQKQMTIINELVETSVHKVNGLEAKTQSISEIVGVIRSIADQTNLLALNASIEAARAGEAGKGFAVVASEVRKLAEQVSNSIQSISAIVYSVKEETTGIAKDLTQGFTEVHKGSEQFERTRKQFSDIKNQVADMSDQVKNISAIFSSVQESGQEINESVEQIAGASEQAAAGSEEISAAAHEQSHSIDSIFSSAKMLTGMVEQMNGLIKKFQL
ncbi:methyl-accepting chemotaxis protein [Bacillus sp. FJAT-42376]|uniref:methyl-accepting chemotaxis protein n=1 Tax=Bacillus sp. FJAT-42376 TaxID=2014076 RepID=UPI000F4D378A|nr:HAMP domain-containing methyl-accepting chemotaxis protein [Bacillus sp. FJAT-42376]AZB41525.1 methyl-accepting chemotaxis protein [Bacillus sp. FJAT-42376]